MSHPGSLHHYRSGDLSESRSPMRQSTHFSSVSSSTNQTSGRTSPLRQHTAGDECLSPYSASREGSFSRRQVDHAPHRHHDHRTPQPSPPNAVGGGSATFSAANSSGVFTQDSGSHTRRRRAAQSAHPGPPPRPTMRRKAASAAARNAGAYPRGEKFPGARRVDGRGNTLQMTLLLIVSVVTSSAVAVFVARSFINFTRSGTSFGDVVDEVQPSVSSSAPVDPQVVIESVRHHVGHVVQQRARSVFGTMSYTDLFRRFYIFAVVERWTRRRMRIASSSLSEVVVEEEEESV